jgi:hypothetical protein
VFSDTLISDYEHTAKRCDFFANLMLNVDVDKDKNNTHRAFKNPLGNKCH